MFSFCSCHCVAEICYAGFAVDSALSDMFCIKTFTHQCHISSWWRGVRDSNPRGPMDHRLSRPAPYQARRTPHRLLCSGCSLKKVSVQQNQVFIKPLHPIQMEQQGRLSSWLGCSPYAAEVAGSNPARPTTNQIKVFTQKRNKTFCQFKN